MRFVYAVPLAGEWGQTVLKESNCDVLTYLIALVHPARLERATP